MIDTLSVNYTDIYGHPAVHVFNLDNVASYGIKFLPKEGRKPARFVVFVAPYPLKSPNTEGPGIIDHERVFQFRFNDFDAAKQAMVFSVRG